MFSRSACRGSRHVNPTAGYVAFSACTQIGQLRSRYIAVVRHSLASDMTGTRTMRRTPLLFVLFLLLTGCASQPEPRTELSWSATRMRADAYYNQGQMVDAVPLYEELLKKEPKNPFFAGRLAYCLLAKFETLATGGERTATVARAKAIAERARKLGDNSNLTRMVLDRVNNPESLVNRLDAKMHAAEALFTRGDMDGALSAYKEIAAEDPKSYNAHLFAGDVYYRKRDYAQAGEWFQKAILIDPNRETAYRYWGDALATADDNEAALSKFTDAVIAEPYNQNAWVGLSQWARKNSVTLDRAQIAIPTSVSGKDGKTINIDARVLEDPQAGAAWLVYSSSRAAWRAEPSCSNRTFLRKRSIATRWTKKSWHCGLP
jgi:tetratricopeptide (TPR) repeat protein